MNKSLVRLEAQLNEMEQKIAFLGSKDPSVSHVSVGWHLAHNLKVIDSVLKGLRHSDPAHYQKSFSWKKELVFLTGKIPRGKARAPKMTHPDDGVSGEEIHGQLQRAREEIRNILTLPKNAFFEHPFFGHVRKEKTPRFLVIHTEHHLKIIRDILK